MLRQAETAAEPVAGAIAGANKRQRIADASVAVTSNSILTPNVGGRAPIAAQAATQIGQEECSESGSLPVPPKYDQMLDTLPTCRLLTKPSADCCQCLAVWHLLYVCILSYIMPSHIAVACTSIVWHLPQLGGKSWQKSVDCLKRRISSSPYSSERTCGFRVLHLACLNSSAVRAQLLSKQLLYSLSGGAQLQP